MSLYKSSPETDVNLLIYVLTRDCKLLELRERLEQTQSTYQGMRVDFLFNMCQHVNLMEALAQVERLDSDTYLQLNKQAKDLGLKQ